MKYRLLPPTTKKVAYHTCQKTNEMIRNDTIARIDRHKCSPDAVLTAELEKLDYEWNIEKCLEANAASLMLLLSILGFQRNQRNWHLLTGTVGFFLLQHSLQGWCPPLPILRKLGVRTTEEINHEKIAYKWYRGDFQQESRNAKDLMDMAEQ
jgi:hypothetical protein